jgi:hypothetical protein
MRAAYKRPKQAHSPFDAPARGEKRRKHKTLSCVQSACGFRVSDELPREFIA